MILEVMILQQKSFCIFLTDRINNEITFHKRVNGLEPSTFCLEGKHSTIELHPHGEEAGTLRHLAPVLLVLNIGE